MAEKKKSPLNAFLDHQKNAIEETGKAIASLLPKDFRDHTGKALDETKASIEVLYDGVIDAVEDGLDKLRVSKDEDANEDEKTEDENE